MTDRVASQTSAMTQKLAEVLFRTFQDESLKMIRASKQKTADLIKESKLKKFGEYDLEKLNRLSGSYGLGNINLDKSYYGVFEEFAIKNKMPFAKTEDEKGNYIIYFSNKNKKEMTYFPKFVLNKNELNKNDIINHAKMGKLKQILVINNLTEDEMKIIDLLKESNDLKYAKVENRLVISKDDYEKFLNEYREVKALIKGKDGKDFLESLNNKKLLNEVIKYKDKKDIEQNRHYIIVDAANPNKTIDLYKEKQKYLTNKDNLTEDEINKILKQSWYMTTPVIMTDIEYTNLLRMNPGEQIELLNTKAKYIFIEEIRDELNPEQISEIDININIKEEQLSNSKTFSAKDFDIILNSKDDSKDISTEISKDRSRWPKEKIMMEYPYIGKHLVIERG